MPMRLFSDVFCGALALAVTMMLVMTTLVSTMSRAMAAPSAVDVIVQEAGVQTLERRIEALGTLRANESVRVTSNVAKTVTGIFFDDGQRVTKGDRLVEMSSAEETALLAEARFNVDDAEKQLERTRALAKSNAVSQSALDQLRREYEAAGARYRALASRLQDLYIDAPFSGVVGLRNLSVGALVSPGDLIATLNDDSQMKVDFSVPAVYLRNVRLNLPIEATSRALGDKTFSGRIVSIDNQINPATRAITVRAIIPNNERELKQGMLMRVELFADKREAIVISEAALVPLGSNNFVYVVKEEDGNTTVERRQVDIGQRMPGTVEIESGLEVAERVVTQGVQKISSGTLVNVKAIENEATKLSELIKSPSF